MDHLITELSKAKYPFNSLLAVHDFVETGRGMAAIRDIKEGEVILEISSDNILTSSKAKQIISEQLATGAEISDILSTPTQLLTCALILVKSQSESLNIMKYSWLGSYVQTIPHWFNLPAFDGKLVKDLPSWISTCLQEQQIRIRNDYIQIKRLFKRHSYQLDYAIFKWAWSAVNTRCLSVVSQTGTEREIALIPVFDMLNHNPAESSLRYTYSDQKSSTGPILFRLYASKPYRKGDQVFINYGPHDNLFLLKEYGFCTSEYGRIYNQFDYIQVDSQVERLWQNCGSNNLVNDKRSLLKQFFHTCSQDFTISRLNHASWKLIMTTKLLVCQHEWELAAWAEMARGSQRESISRDNEEKALELLSTIIKDCKEEIKEALGKISVAREPQNEMMKQCLVSLLQMCQMGEI